MSNWEEQEKYIYYTINRREQLFKQLSGFLYFLRMAKSQNKCLILPRFEIQNDKTKPFIKYEYFEIFDSRPIIENFNVVPFAEFLWQSRKRWDLNQKTEAWIDGNWQFPYNQKDYMDYRKFVRFQDRYYEDVDNFLKDKEPYISVHWRQDDFLRIRPDVIMTKEELVKDTKEKLKKYKVNKVYVATDSTDKGILEYIHDNLPVIKFESKLPNIQTIEKSILESIICAKGKFFTGTLTSLFSIHILGERLNMGIDDKYSEIKQSGPIKMEIAKK
jgi:hypothetical protein